MRLNLKQSKLSQWCALNLFAMTVLASAAQAYDSHALTSDKCEKLSQNDDITAGKDRGGELNPGDFHGYVCELKDDFGVSHVGCGETSSDARTDAISKCQNDGHPKACSQEPHCESIGR